MDSKLTNVVSDQIRKFSRSGVELLAAVAVMLFLYGIMVGAFIEVTKNNPPLNAQQIRKIPAATPAPSPSICNPFTCWMSTGIPEEMGK